ncbi:MAG: GNAT family N-acetyltransferase [Acidobacteria bacterium]|nr:GNAT family N-acetyltransferase [Acidobacteriota bacterium]
MRTIDRPAPAADDLRPSRLVLRDGTVVAVRAAGVGDADEVARFFQALSPESRYRRFLSVSLPPAALIRRFCETTDPAHSSTLIASRGSGSSERIVALASYMAIDAGTAEASFAVADGLQGKGVGTLLLEHLAAQAASVGFGRFHATTLAENAAMLEVFKESGFQIRARVEHGCAEVELSLTLPLEGVAAAERRRQRATVASLRPLLEPSSVAVIGASRDPTKIGSRILRALREAGLQGDVYAVHPRAKMLGGLPTVRSARDLPPAIDLAVVAVPVDVVPAVVDDCAAAGVRSLLTITAGYAEAGHEGRRAQAALLAQVRGYGMRMIGPNCLGVLNPAIGLNASFSPIMPVAGRVAFSSQSGALGIAILELARGRHIGLSGFVSVGNKADVSGNDLLEYWEDDADTGVILLYLESFGNPRRFARIARRVARTKPVVALKAGRTRAGSRAAGSHTAALASNDAAVSALFHQTGVIRAETIDEMFDIAAALDSQELPRGCRVAIVTNGGGPGILAADACEGAGLTMAQLAPVTLGRLAALLPATASLHNPVDVVAGAGPEQVQGALEAVLADEGVDALIVLFTPVDTARAFDVVQAIAAGVERARHGGGAGKTVLACLMSAGLRDHPLMAGTEMIPTYAFPEQAVRALGRIADYAAWRRQPPSLYWDFEDADAPAVRAICRAALAARGTTWLTGGETDAVLRAFHLPASASTVTHTPEEAIAAAARLGYPVAAKLLSAAVLHKTDVGGVRLDLTGPDEVRTAFGELEAIGHALDPAAFEGVLLQEMIRGGAEMLIGISHDPVFGPLVAFGLGGVDVDWLGDVRFRVSPLTDWDADEMIRGIRGFPLLDGYRGRPRADLAALRQTILRVSRLAEEVPEIVELDLNPVIARPAGLGCRILDARIRVAPASEVS